MAKPITPKQLSYIEKLVGERLGAELAEAGITIQQWMEDNGVFELTVQSASAFIEALKALGKEEAPEEAPAAAPDDAIAAALASADRVITNRRAQDCAACGSRVEEGKGKAALYGRTWRCYHATSADCTEGGAPQVAQPSQDTWQLLQDLDEGFYAIESLTGNNDLDFFAVKVNKGFHNPANKGKKFLVRVIGGQEPVFVRRGVEQDRVVAALAALDAEGRLAAQVLFGQAIGQCGRCGRHLTDEESRKRGIGPDCWARG